MQSLRITTKPLQSKFMSQLDYFSNKLMQIFKSKGGVKGQRIKEVLSITDSRDNINTRRECILRCLIIYLNEDPDTFFKEYLAPATEDAERNLATTVMGIYVIRSDGDHEPEDVGVVIEGIKVLSNLGSVIMGFHNEFGWAQAECKDTTVENQAVCIGGQNH